MTGIGNRKSGIGAGPGGRGAVRGAALVLLLAEAALLGAAASLLGICGPFTDVSDAAFCPFVIEISTLGITAGTTPTTYDPSSAVTRLQMAAFLSRTVDRNLGRASPRAIRQQFWTPAAAADVGVTTLGAGAGSYQVKSDGEDLWVANTGGWVSRVHASDGKLLETWTAPGAIGALVAMGRVFATGVSSPGVLYRIDPSQAAGAATAVATNLGDEPYGMAFDGGRIWTANFHTVSIATPTAVLPYTVTTVTAGFSDPTGIVFDGSSVWVADWGAGKLLKLDGAGSALQTVTISGGPEYPAFDGTNLWVPVTAGELVVVRASTGAVLATLTGNNLNSPVAAAFDGQRIMVTNANAFGALSLWRASDFAPLGSFVGVGSPNAICSDGTNFWVTMGDVGKLIRF